MQNRLPVLGATLLLITATAAPVLADYRASVDPEGQAAASFGDDGLAADPNGRSQKLPGGEDGGHVASNGRTQVEIEPDGWLLEPTVDPARAESAESSGRGSGADGPSGALPGQRSEGMFADGGSLDPNGRALRRLEAAGDHGPGTDPSGWFGNPWIDPPDVPSSPPPTIA